MPVDKAMRNTSGLVAIWACGVLPTTNVSSRMDSVPPRRRSWAVFRVRAIITS